MSHKNKKLSWYQLYLRIKKMQLGNAKENYVTVEVNGVRKPATLEYDKNGEIAYLKVED